MLSEALRLIRIYHDLRQNELAERLGISKSHLSEIERGKKTPSLDVIQKYANEFSIPASSILFFSENIDHPNKVNIVKSAIASKVLKFLQIIEEKTKSEQS